MESPARGVPHRSDFDIDANGIACPAKDLGTGKDQKISITGSSGLERRSREDAARSRNACRRGQEGEGSDRDQETHARVSMREAIEGALAKDLRRQKRKSKTPSQQCDAINRNDTDAMKRTHDDPEQVP
jgi:molecular chaperone DnaK